MRSFVLAAAFILLACSPLLARTWYVQPDGSGDAPTITAAIDSSTAGDVIELGCGTYYEWGLEPKSGITIRSETGQPDCVTIDGQYFDYYGAIFQCWSVDSSTTLEGLTITGGKSTDPYMGFQGGGLVIGWSDLMLVRCHITGNLAKMGGGVVIYQNSHPSFVECEIWGNEAIFNVGGILVFEGGSFHAYETSFGPNISHLPPLDGLINPGGEAYFHCCELDLQNWEIDGYYEVDDANCDPVSTETQTWGSVKAMFR